jgi:hypothetical protein
MLSVVMLSVSFKTIMLGVKMLSGIMLSVSFKTIMLGINMP